MSRLRTDLSDSNDDEVYGGCSMTESWLGLNKYYRPDSGSECSVSESVKVKISLLPCSECSELLIGTRLSTQERQDLKQLETDASSGGGHRKLFVKVRCCSAAVQFLICYNVFAL